MAKQTRTEGTLTKWDDVKGFGFISPNGGGSQVFVHATSFLNRKRRPVEQETLSFEVNEGRDDRLQAVKVTFAGESVDPIRGGEILTFLAIGFLLLLGVLVKLGILMKIELIYYLAISSLTFATYGLDKLAAKQERSRTRESTLHWLSFIGGWPGALIGQFLFNHKTTKESFQNIFWLTLFANVTCLGLLHSKWGAPVLKFVQELI